MPIPFTALPALPVAAGETLSPAAVSQAALLHLTVDPLPFPVVMAQWASLGDSERLILTKPGTASGLVEGVTVQLNRTTADLVPLDGAKTSVLVDGHAATLAVSSGPFAVLRWQPVAGLWAEVSGALDAAGVQTLAADVRLDRTFRCVVPFRLTNLPAGAQLSTCQLAFDSTVFTGSLTVAVGDWFVTVLSVPGALSTSTSTLGGHPAQVSEEPGDGGHKIMEVRVDYGNGYLADLTAEGPYDPAEVTAIALGFVAATGTDPAGWPADPLH